MAHASGGTSSESPWNKAAVIIALFALLVAGWAAYQSYLQVAAGREAAIGLESVQLSQNVVGNAQSIMFLRLRNWGRADAKDIRLRAYLDNNAQPQRWPQREQERIETLEPAAVAIMTTPGHLTSAAFLGLQDKRKTIYGHGVIYYNDAGTGRTKCLSWEASVDPVTKQTTVRKSTVTCQ